MSVVKTGHKAAFGSRTQSGMTLIEVLVSVVVVSVGLLGIAALQVTTLQNTHNSMLRTQASALADDILDRMRSNRTAALNGDYNRVIGDAAPSATATRADNDMQEWYASLKTLLPNTQAGSADGEINIDAANRTATIKIQWGETVSIKGSVNLGTDNALTFVTATEL